MKTYLCALAMFTFFCFASGAANRPVFAQAVVIRGGTLIDGNGGEPVRDPLIIIEGGRFRTVTTVGNAPIPAGVKVIEADGKYILPGFIDGHMHLADWHNELYLNRGITTLVDLANVVEWTLAQKEAVAMGKIRGPRIFASTAAINGPDAFGGRKAAVGTMWLASRKTEENLFQVRAWIDQGVDVVKFRWEATLEIVRVMAGEARRRGLPTICHCDLNVMQSVPLGILKAEHGTGIAEAVINDPAKWARVQNAREQGHPYIWDWSFVEPGTYGSRIDEVIRFLIKNNVHVEPTFESAWKGVYPETAEFLAYDLEFLHSNPALLNYIPDSSIFWFGDYSFGGDPAEIPKNRKRLQKGYRNFQYFIRRFVELGGKLDVDSDQSKDSIAGISHDNEMILTQSAGLTPMQVIVAATRNPAEWLGKLEDLGTIEEGKLGDLIILTKDPLADIRNVKGNVETVIIGGKEMDTSFHPDWRNPIPGIHQVDKYDNEIPELDWQVVPRIVVEGSDSVTVTVKGRYFLRGTQASFKSVPVATRIKDSGVMEITIPSRLLEEVGTWPITAINPPPTEGFSRPVYLMVKFRPDGTVVTTAREQGTE